MKSLVVPFLISVFASASFADVAPEDQRILNRGPVPHGRYVTGGVLGSVVGFGLGHTVQGRYRERGWIFTAGEGGSLLLIIASTVRCLETTEGPRKKNCDNDPALMTAGLAGLIGFRLWEIIDLWVTPAHINRRYEELTRDQVTMQVAPVMVSETTPGLGLRLTF